MILNVIMMVLCYSFLIFFFFVLLGNDLSDRNRNFEHVLASFIQFEMTECMREKEPMTIISELMSFASTAWPVMLTCLFEILPGLASIVVVGHFCSKEVRSRTSVNTRDEKTNHNLITPQYRN